MIESAEDIKSSCDGSITVFLSLILLIILSVVFTTIEAARVNGGRMMGSRTFSTAVNSIFAEYYTPLFDEYHIFALDSGYGMKDTNMEVLINKLNESMEYSFEPTQNLEVEIPWIKPYQLYQFNIEETKVGEIQTLLDTGGVHYFKEAIEYMKYKNIGKGIDRLLGHISYLKEEKKAEVVLSKKIETEEKLYEIDEKIFALMYSIDGIGFLKNWWDIGNKENITVGKEFVKLISNGNATMETMGVNNQYLFSLVQDRYVSLDQYTEGILQEIEFLEENLAKKESTINSYQRLLEISTVKMSSKEIEELKQVIQSLSDQISEYERMEEQGLNNINRQMSTIHETSQQVLSAISKSMEMIKEIQEKQKIAEESIQEYESVLEGSKDEISEELYESLIMETKNYTKYKTQTSTTVDQESAYNFERMESTLLYNLEIIERIQEESQRNITSDSASWGNFSSKVRDMENIIKGYSYQYLFFDYSTYRKQENDQQMLQNIMKLFEDGIMSVLPIDTKTYSDRVLDESDLPSGDILETLESNSDKTEIKIQEEIENKVSVTKNMFQMFSSVIQGFDESDQWKDLSESILFVEYLAEHFHYYALNEESIEEKSMEKKSEDNHELQSLSYELEYVLFGNLKDYDNIKEMITKLVIMRTMSNLIYLLGDGKRSQEAYTFALGMVGFTGMPALVNIIKLVLLTCWAMVESFIDVTGLLYGKQVPMYKNGTNFQVNFQDLLLVDQDYLKEKAEQLPSTASIGTLSYKEYLMLFLYVENEENKIFRSLDLIQINIQKKYHENFYIRNCFFGFQGTTLIHLKKQFVTFPFVMELVSEDSKDSYGLSFSYEYSY